MSHDQHTFANLAQFNFGEKLVEEVFKILALKKNVPFYGFTDAEIWEKVIDQQPLTGFQFITDAQLMAEFPGEKAFSPNGMSRVDVLAYNDKGIPVEVKLGITGGAASFPSTFLGKWKEGDFLKNIDGAKNKSSFSGNMIQILDSSRKLALNGALATFTACFKNNSFELEDEWWLVIRKDSLSADCASKMTIVQPHAKQSFKKLSKVFVFEDLWEKISDNERTMIIQKLTAIMEAQFVSLSSLVPFKD